MIKNMNAVLRTMRGDNACLHTPILASVDGGIQGIGVSADGHAPVRGRVVGAVRVEPKFAPSFTDGVHRSVSLEPPV